MPKVKWNPQPSSERVEQSPIVWSCFVAMRADGTFETEFNGATGFQMFKAAMDALQTIDQIRNEPAYDFGRTR